MLCVFTRQVVVIQDVNGFNVGVQVQVWTWLVGVGVSFSYGPYVSIMSCKLMEILLCCCVILAVDAPYSSMTKRR